MRDRRQTGGARVGVVLAVLVLGAVAALLAATAVRAGATGRATAVGTSLRADESGHRAARLLLEELGFVAHSRRRARLPEGTGHVMVRVEGLPGADGSDAPQRERDAAGLELAEWVERGNAALVLGARQVEGTGWPRIRDRVDLAAAVDVAGPPVVAPAPATAPTLDLLFGVRPEVPSDGGDITEVHAVPGLGDPWITPYHVVVAGAGDEVLATRGEGDDAEPVVVLSRRAKGRVATVADPWFAVNARIARADNAAWVAELATRLHDGGEIWFDDRALGEVATRGVLSLLTERGMGPALAAALLFVGIVWWRLGPSDAPERRVRTRHEYRPEAYAEVRADLYAACLTGHDIRRVVAYEIARRLGRGDTTTPERAVRLLAVRDPERAAAVREAVGALPDSAVAPYAEHPRLWTRSVAAVWAALAGPTGPTGPTGPREDPQEENDDV